MAGHGCPAAVRFLRWDVACRLARRGGAHHQRRAPSRSARLSALSVRVAFAGGGTGGHIYPALGIDDALRAAFPGGAYEPRFFGNRAGLEATLVSTMPLQFIPSAALQRRADLRALRTLAVNAAGIIRALRALTAFRPRMLVATGGYVCFPVVVAARALVALGLLRCRIALLEINVSPGLTNRLLGPLVDEAWITYPESARYFGGKAVLSGTPVRSALFAPRSAAAARTALGLDPARTTIVVMGGSQGARSINTAVADLLAAPDFPPAWQVLHVSGERDHAVMQGREAAALSAGRVRLVGYLPDPRDAYAAADIVVARAGASTLAELAATATPAVLVPYPFAAGGHQAANAAAFERAGAALVIRDADLDAAALLAALRHGLEQTVQAPMRIALRTLAAPNAARTIVDRITACLAPRVADSREPNEVGRD